MKIYLCPKCKKVLEITSTSGLWCKNNCYESEFAIWEALQPEKEKEALDAIPNLMQFPIWYKEKKKNENQFDI